MALSDRKLSNLTTDYRKIHIVYDYSILGFFLRKTNNSMKTNLFLIRRHPASRIVVMACGKSPTGREACMTRGVNGSMQSRMMKYVVSGVFSFEDDEDSNSKSAQPAAASSPPVQRKLAMTALSTNRVSLGNFDIKSNTENHDIIIIIEFIFIALLIQY